MRAAEAEFVLMGTFHLEYPQELAFVIVASSNHPFFKFAIVLTMEIGLSSCETSDINICSGRKLSDLECADDYEVDKFSYSVCCTSLGDRTPQKMSPCMQNAPIGIRLSETSVAFT